MIHIELKQFSSNEALQDAVFGLLTQTIESSRGTADMFAVLLAGGSTPLPIYNRIATTPLLPNDGLRIGFTDDRHVPADSPDSNYGNVLPMIRNLKLPDNRVMRVNDELPLDQAAMDYGDQVEAFLKAGGVIELAVAGLGSDGHTCSIFTPEAAHDEEAFAFAVEGEAGFNRVSIGRRVLLATKRVIFLVAGASKREILERFAGNPQSTPAGIAIDGHPRVELWTDVSFVPAE